MQKKVFIRKWIFGVRHGKMGNIKKSHLDSWLLSPLSSGPSPGRGVLLSSSDRRNTLLFGRGRGIRVCSSGPGISSMAPYQDRTGSYPDAYWRILTDRCIPGIAGCRQDRGNGGNRYRSSRRWSFFPFALSWKPCPCKLLYCTGVPITSSQTPDDY